jgi:hypothetical protein
MFVYTTKQQKNLITHITYTSTVLAEFFADYFSYNPRSNNPTFSRSLSNITGKSRNSRNMTTKTNKIHIFTCDTLNLELAWPEIWPVGRSCVIFQILGQIPFLGRDQFHTVGSFLFFSCERCASCDSANCLGQLWSRGVPLKVGCWMRGFVGINPSYPMIQHPTFSGTWSKCLLK